MKYRYFGKTDLKVSEIGFGSWAIGGAAKAGNIPIGWGKTDDNESLLALRTAFEQGINFYDTADFYGLGHSEELIGKVFGNSEKAIIATKVGQKTGVNKPVEIDYSKSYILKACESSLKRLQRECIDYYQLHVANVSHLEQGDCVEAMEELQQQGKIRYWGASLFTFDPFPEAAYLMNHRLGYGFQLAFNIINQKAVSLFGEMSKNGYGIIARMPLQFGLLAGKFSTSTQFDETDHRSFRLTPKIIETAALVLQDIWAIAEKYDISKVSLALSFVMSFPEISTTIPGIRTARQALSNTAPLIRLSGNDRDFISKNESGLKLLLEMMQALG